MPNQSETQTTYMLVKTRRKWQKLADLDRRSLVDTYDVHADSELMRRGIDPETLEPTDRAAQPAEAASASEES